jgi:hypothetical protein
VTIDWIHDAQAVAASALTTAILSPILAWYLRGRENLQLNAQNKEIETLKSRQREIENRAKTQFDWLHQKRAEAAVEIYSLIIEVDFSLTRLLEEFAHGNPTVDEKNAQWLKTNDLAAMLRKRCAQVALLLPETVFESLEELNDLLWKARTLAFVYGREQSAEDRIFLSMNSQVTKIHASINALRGLLRNALGDVATEARQS